MVQRYCKNPQLVHFRPNFFSIFLHKFGSAKNEKGCQEGTLATFCIFLKESYFS